MKITHTIELNPTDKQKNRLLATMREFAETCNKISKYAWQNKVFRSEDLYAALHEYVTIHYKLGSQVMPRAFSKVAKNYRIDASGLKCFDPYSTVIYSKHSLDYYPHKEVASIWTIEGRQHVKYVQDDKIGHFLPHQRGDSYLVYIQDKFYLVMQCEILDTDGTLKDIIALSLH